MLSREIMRHQSHITPWTRRNIDPANVTSRPKGLLLLNHPQDTFMAFIR